MAPKPGDHRLVIPEIEHDNDYKQENYYLKESNIEADTVDNMMRELNINHLNYIEIMVNGAELHVLQGKAGRRFCLEETLNMRNRLMSFWNFRVFHVILFALIGVTCRTAIAENKTQEGFVFLSDLEPVTFQGHAELGRDEVYQPHGNRNPLAMGGFIYKKGLSLHASSIVTYDLDSKYNQFQCLIGVYDFAKPKCSTKFVVKVDDQMIYESEVIRWGMKPQFLNFSVKNAKRLTLLQDDVGNGVAGDQGIWADAVLFKTNVSPPPSSRGEMSGVKFKKADIHFFEPAGVYEYNIPIEDKSPGFQIALKSYGDELDPDIVPDFIKEGDVIRITATPGEYEPATFVIYATRDLKNTDIKVSDLSGPGGVFPANSVDIRRVIRTRMRYRYTAKARNTRIVNRFLPTWKSMNIKGGEFREIWLTCKVPVDILPGSYTGEIHLTYNEGRVHLPVELVVLPFKLITPAEKGLGMYYNISQTIFDPEQAKLELVDIRDHGVNNLKLDIGISYVPEKEGVESRHGVLEHVLTLIRDAGFRGTVVVNTGFGNMLRLLGYQAFIRQKEMKALEEDREVTEVARNALMGINNLQKKFPELDLVVTHMDEVFNRGRLPFYIERTKLVRLMPEMRMYITINTRDDATEKMRAKIDPYVDIRGHNGHSFEQWLANGHTIEEYRLELQTSGDEAWFYHNARGVWWTAEWSRIINGLYLWASPFKVHCPWVYQRFVGNPYDDTDSGHQKHHHDFGFAFPDPDDPNTLVPTRIWECMREGYDDVRYIFTLQELIRTKVGQKPKQAEKAQKYLDKLRNLFEGARPTDKPVKVIQKRSHKSKLDFDSPILFHKKQVKGSAKESPLINAVAIRFQGYDWDGIREKLIEHILALK